MATGRAWHGAPPCDPADPPSIFERRGGGGTLLAPFLLGSGDEINPTRRADRKPCMELFDRGTEAAEAEGCMRAESNRPFLAFSARRSRRSEEEGWKRRLGAVGLTTREPQIVLPSLPLPD